MEEIDPAEEPHVDTIISYPKMRTGEPAPDFELTGTDDEVYSLADFEDNDALLVVFTCDHVLYARVATPYLNDFADEYDDVAVVGINPNYAGIAGGSEESSLETMKEYVKGDLWYIEEPVRYDAYLKDEHGRVARAYGADVTPESFLFENTEDGFRLVYQGRLYDPLELHTDVEREYARDFIDAVLNDEPVETEFVPAKGRRIHWGTEAQMRTDD